MLSRLATQSGKRKKNFSTHTTNLSFNIEQIASFSWRKSASRQVIKKVTFCPNFATTSRLFHTCLLKVPSTVAASWGRPFASRALSTSASKNSDNPWDGPERDLKNFPRRKKPVEPAPTRHHWIPEGYFKLFYPKTGVTGPYAFAATTLTYLLSKEIWVIEHEFVAGLGQLAFLVGVVKMAGPSFVEEWDKEIDAHEAGLKRMRQDEIDKCKAAISAEELAQFNATSYEELIQAKKDAVGLQLEANYRQRLNEAYTQVTL